jgi:hypothetical protein
MEKMVLAKSYMAQPRMPFFLCDGITFIEL